MHESNSGPGKKPLAVYAILDRKQKNFWMRIGSAFSNRDGSFTLYLDAIPLGTNRLQVREQRAFDDGLPLPTPSPSGTSATAPSGVQS